MVRGFVSIASKARAAAQSFTFAAVDTALVFLPTLKVFIEGAERWGQGVWGGPPGGPTVVKETCRWAPMPGFDGPARP